MKKVASCVVVVAFVAGCMSTSNDEPSGPPPECRYDQDCAHLDNDTDPCTVVKCNDYKCVPQIEKSTTSCQCAVDADCTQFFGSAPSDCAVYQCTDHKCVQSVAPAGSGPRQVEGDCSTINCDGKVTAGAKTIDPKDVPKSDGCSTATCTADGQPSRATLVDGTACGDGSVCFAGQCTKCAPANASSCGGEGPSEPANSQSTGAIAYTQSTAACGFSDPSDVDWYTFFAKDADFTHDVLRFHFWSSAASMKVCVYVKCQDGGTPNGGCSSLLPGPDGSQGCCYSGPAGSIDPNWDLDCSNSTEDSGTVYVSVETPGSSSCERYIMDGSY